MWIMFCRIKKATSSEYHNTKITRYFPIFHHKYNRSAQTPFPYLPLPPPHHSTPNTPLNPSPNLLIASCTCSAPAAANVIRKNISSPPSASARNQLPLLDNTPRSIPAWKTSSSISSIDFICARGCRGHSILIQWNMPAAGAFQLAISRGRNFSQALQILSLRLVYSPRRLMSQSR